MNTLILDPRLSELETQEMVDNYDKWFRQQIEFARQSETVSHRVRKKYARMGSSPE